MKGIKIVIMLLMFSLFINSIIIVGATSQGYPTHPISKERREELSNSINLSKMTKEPEKRGVECFAVNEEGLLAVGLGALSKKEIAVYSPDGVFQYGYTFNKDGEFGIEWENDQIVIYFIRGDFAVAVTAEGKIERIVEILPPDSDSAYRKHPAFATKQMANEKEYVLKNGLGFWSFFVSGYTQIEVTDSLGNVQTIYDADQSQQISAIIVFAFILLFAGIVLVPIIRQIVRFVKNEVLDH
ncbi:MAG: hypothetical protein IJO76_02140 [Clostridia bacterium]|nr:hypothetical protein [Clostridia bacterium]